MLTPVEFLLARVTDLEAVARGAQQGRWHVGDTWIDGGGYAATVMSEVGRESYDVEPVAWMLTFSDQPRASVAKYPDAAHIATWDPAFVLAWCTAVRQMVEPLMPGSPRFADYQGYPGTVVRALLQPFADHPDFDPAWRTET